MDTLVYTVSHETKGSHHEPIKSIKVMNGIFLNSINSKSVQLHLDVSENSGKIPPKSSIFNRVFHDFHHPFWGVSPYFWNPPTQHLNSKSRRSNVLTCAPLRRWLMGNFSTGAKPTKFDENEVKKSWPVNRGPHVRYPYLTNKAWK